MFYAMDLTKKAAAARFKIGDRVLLVGPLVWTVTGRYWRQSLGCVVYQLRYHNGMEVRVRESELMSAEPTR